ncbi:AAA family ATPase [Actinacidiphila guanduensis]|uniref:Rad50/SbcC-type AAA domain-containing protein n=1 Tax=Actinacidiphila guanduensis TaxID=310781 RepID=A0A1H0KJ64_9ACTN|nr:hypothetical protein SAMN05216259_110270 [Actinacidiphila guanduensis]
MSSSQPRPIVTELRLSAFKSHRGANFALDPITLLTGASGTGKSSVLEALAVLGRLAAGAELPEVFGAGGAKSVVRGGAAACIPQGAQPDGEGRRGFRIGCTATGPLGPLRLDLAVQVEPSLRIVGERLTGVGETLLTTALRDPTRRTVQAAWHTAGVVAVTRAPLPDSRLATSLLPLRVAGRTEGQRLVLAAAEQMVVALRGVFPIAPRPETMRAPVRLGDGRLRSACDNLSAVLARTEGECGIRHGMLVKAVRDVCSGPVERLTTVPAARVAGSRGGPTVDGVIAAVDRGDLGMVPIDRLGDGELRFLALALVLLTGPGVLDVDTSTELLPAGQVLTVVADGLDLGVDRRQARELLRLAGLAASRGHIRLLATVQDPSCADDLEGVSLTVVGAEEAAAAKEPGGAGEDGAASEAAMAPAGETASADAEESGGRAGAGGSAGAEGTAAGADRAGGKAPIDEAVAATGAGADAAAGSGVGAKVGAEVSAEAGAGPVAAAGPNAGSDPGSSAVPAAGPSAGPGEERRIDAARWEDEVDQSG